MIPLVQQYGQNVNSVAESMVSLIIALANSIYLKVISEKTLQITNITKRSIILLISSTDLRKLKSLIKLHDQKVVTSSSLEQTLPNQNHNFIITR